MKNKKGFTLVELLAVIVILAVIALIATPQVLRIIEEARKGAFEQTIYSIIKAGNIYKTKEELTGGITECRYFSFSSNVEEKTVRDEKTYYPIKDLNLKGKLPTEGELKICKDSMRIDVSDGEYSGSSDGEKVTVSKGDLSSNDFEEPIIDVFNIRSSLYRIIVVVNAHSPSVGGLITNYYYKINDGKYIKTTEKSYVFEELKPNTEYKITVKVENKSGVEKEESKIVRTTSYGEIKYEVEQAEEWTTSKKVTFINNTEYKLEYKIMYYEEGSKEEKESEFEEYKEPIIIDKMATAEYPVTVTARYKSEGKYSSTKDISIVKIDTTKPTLALGAVTKTTNSIEIPYGVEDKESGIKETECEYGENNTYGSKGKIKDNKCVISGLKQDKTYYYKIITINNSGLKEEKIGSTETSIIKKATVTYTNDPTPIPTSGYLKSQKIKIEFNNTDIESPKYYVKTTREGTINKGVEKSCEKNEAPGKCTNITSTTTLKENTWYEVSGNFEVTYNTSSAEDALLTSAIYDGTNYSYKDSSINKIYYQAENISYTNSTNSSVTNVKEALDDLYSKIK